MPFTNCVSFNYALHQLDLFDNIEGKYLKYYFQGKLDLDEYDFEVDIEEVEKEDSKRGFVLIVEYQLKNPKWIYNKNVLGNNFLNIYDIPEYITFTTELDYHESSPLAILIHQDLYEESDDEEEEEVRCVCDKCFGEGKCYVSKERARELERLEEMENECPYGDKCEEEEEEEQYQEKCPHCEKRLCIDTNIMCWEGEKGEERTLCMECYMDYEYWKTDMNECNWKQELDWGNGCEESSDESDDEFEGIDFTKTNEIIAELKK